MASTPVLPQKLLSPRLCSWWSDLAGLLCEDAQEGFSSRNSTLRFPITKFPHISPGPLFHFPSKLSPELSFFQAVLTSHSMLSYWKIRCYSPVHLPVILHHVQFPHLRFSLLSFYPFLSGYPTSLLHWFPIVAVTNFHKHNSLTHTGLLLIS